MMYTKEIEHHLDLIDQDFEKVFETPLMDRIRFMDMIGAHTHEYWCDALHKSPLDIVAAFLGKSVDQKHVDLFNTTCK